MNVPPHSVGMELRVSRAEHILSAYVWWGIQELTVNGTLVIYEINIIIIYLHKIAILHHWMLSFHVIVYCTLVYCTIADRSDRCATSISLREHENADRFDVEIDNYVPRRGDI